MLLEVLNFIFSDIYHFIGTAILLDLIFGGLKGIIPKRKR